MFMTVYLVVALLLIFLNAFFVMAELSVVKARPTLIQVLAEKGNRRAKILEHAQTRLDEYLSVCQVGVTCTSIGLGFVGEPAVAVLLEPLVTRLGIAGPASRITSSAIAIAAAFVLVSYFQILFGELIPKSVAIRKTEKIALLTIYPMVVFRYLFIVPIWFLTTTVNGVLYLLRLPRVSSPAVHTEDEVRIILDHSQSSGMLSFRQLLHIENVLDMGALTVRNAMRVRRNVKSLGVGMTREELDKIIAEGRYSRFPIVGNDPDTPIGYVHIKDLFLAERAGKSTDSLSSFVRSCLKAKEEDHLEHLLSEMQRKACHMTMVYSKEGKWTGIITLEDALEEVIGTIEEEYPTEPPVRLSDLLSSERTFLDVEGDSILSVVRNVLHRMKKEDLPLSRDAIMLSVMEREKLGSSYVGKGLAIPHARLKGLANPMVIVCRLESPINAPAPGEKINLIFLLLTPVDLPRIHQILLSHIAGIFESDFLEGRLEDAASPAELYSVISTAEQVVLG